MKVYFTFIFALIISCTYSQVTGIKSINPIHSSLTQRYLPNKVIFKLKSGYSIDQLLKMKPQLFSVIKGHSLIQKHPSVYLHSTASLNQSTNAIGVDRIYELDFLPTVTMEEVLRHLLANESVEYAEPKFINQVQFVPNDELYNSPGQTYLNQVKSSKAWEVFKQSGSKLQSIIAIVDNGSNLDHPDLSGNIYVNTNDPINGIDDDKDGYVDNYYGWDFVGRSASSMIQDNDPNVKGILSDHGVHVSGIAGGVSDNNIGITSLSLNSGKLMIIKTASDDNSTDIVAGYEGIKYAADHGANIINCSWGGPGGGLYGRDIINYSLAKGCLIIAAAGNDNTDFPDYPASYPGVISVANVDESDKKNESSNYGYSVSLSAPGTNILSTSFGSYKKLSGTSMSAPVVSGAAALLASYFPTLSMKQVGEKLRVTADNIDLSNPNYKGLLGNGRLNVYRALTESMPSVRNQKIIYKKGGDIKPGDTIRLSFDLKNFLTTATYLSVGLSSNSRFIKMVRSQHYVGKLVGSEMKLVGEYEFIVDLNTPENEDIVFRLNYQSDNGLYKDYEIFNILISPDYLNVEVNKISTTVTSVGKVGYSLPNRQGGVGFGYKSESLLYESALMIGMSPTKVSDNARSTQGSHNNHFSKKDRVKQVASSKADFEGAAEFDDSKSSIPLNIDIKNRMFAYSLTPDDKYIISEYEITNKNKTALNGLYIGLLTDFDTDNLGISDVSKYDSFTNTAYVYNKQGKGAFAGVKVLNKDANLSYYAFSANDGLMEDNNFSIADKFETLSSGIKFSGAGVNNSEGVDVVMVTGAGPYNIEPSQSIKIAFAIIAGDDFSDLRKSAMQAQRRYLQTSSVHSSAVNIELQQNFPNPVRNHTTIEFSLAHPGMAILELYNYYGQKLKTIVEENLEEGFYSISADLSSLPNGVYFYKLQQNKDVKTLKLTVLR